jgi:RNA polymerase sigma factor (sigma-70 family)
MPPQGSHLMVEYTSFVLIEAGTLGKLWRQCVHEPYSPIVWEQFLERSYPLLIRIARSTGARWGVRGRDEVDDLVQDICLKLSQQARSAATLPECEDAMEVYLKTMAVNAARDSLRARFAGKRGKDVTVALEDRMATLTAKFDRERPDQDVFLGQIEELLPGSARDRAVFWLYYRSGLTSNAPDDAIAA